MDGGWLGCRQLGKFLAEDLVHDLRASGKGWHDVVPVDQLGRSGLVVSSEQRYRLHRHTMRRQQRYERMPQLPWHPRAAKPGGLGDLAKLPPDQIISNDHGRSRHSEGGECLAAGAPRAAGAGPRAPIRRPAGYPPWRATCHVAGRLRMHDLIRPSTSLVTCAWATAGEWCRRVLMR